MPKIKNILIFIAIAAVFVLIYIYFIKPKPQDTLISSNPNASATGASSAGTITSEENSKIAQDFLSLLLNVKKIRLNDAIFVDSAFTSLHDSSITLVQDGNEGRINPFAPIGSDAVTILPPTCTALQVLNTITNTCVTRAICTSSQFLNTTTNTCVARQTCTLPQVLNPSTNTCGNPPSN